MPLRLTLILAALAFGALAGGILAVQRRATSCSHHSRAAGRIALALAALCALASGGCLALAFGLA